LSERECEVLGLLARGLLRESAETAGPRGLGRPHIPLEIDTGRYLVAGGHIAVANSTIGPDPTQIGDETLTNMLDYLGNNSDVWLGWTWWAGGPKWGNYMFTLDPTNLGAPNQADRPAMSILQPYVTSVPEPASFLTLAAAAAYLVHPRRRPSCS